MPRHSALAVSAVALVTTAQLVFLHAAPAPGSALSRIRETGKLTFGYRADARPFAYTDDAGNAAGYSIALCQKIADQAKTDLRLPALTVRWVPVMMENRFRALQVPINLAMRLRAVQPYGFLILLALIATGMLNYLIGPPYYLLLKWLNGQ